MFLFLGKITDFKVMNIKCISYIIIDLLNLMGQ